HVTRSSRAESDRTRLEEPPLLGFDVRAGRPERPVLFRRGGRVVRQRPAKPRTAVQFRSPPRGSNRSGALSPARIARSRFAATILTHVISRSDTRAEKVPLGGGLILSSYVESRLGGGGV